VGLAVQRFPLFIIEFHRPSDSNSHSSVTTGTHVFIFARTLHFGQRFVEKSTELQTTKQMKKRMDLLVSSSAVNPSLILEEIVSVSRHSSD
jgi:hypothetical protein